MSLETVEATNQPLDVEAHSILMVATLSKEGATSETSVGGLCPPCMEKALSKTEDTMSVKLTCIDVGPV